MSFKERFNVNKYKTVEELIDDFLNEIQQQQKSYAESTAKIVTAVQIVGNSYTYGGIMWNE